MNMSCAVVAYTGYGTHAEPQADAAAVANSRFLVGKVRRLVDEAQRIDAGPYADRQTVKLAISAAHPELGPAACGALAWVWSFSR